MTAPQGDKVHQVLVALTQLGQTVLGGDVNDPDAYQVIDGPPLHVEQNYVAFGFTDVADEQDVVFDDTDPADLSMGVDQLVFDVAAVISRWSGDADTPGVRAYVTTALLRFRAALRADPTLGGLVDHSFVRLRSLSQPISGEGSVVSALLSIHVQAWE